MKRLNLEIHVFFKSVLCHRERCASTLAMCQQDNQLGPHARSSSVCTRHSVFVTQSFRVQTVDCNRRNETDVRSRLASVSLRFVKDERNQVLIAYLWIRQKWNDAYLRWNKEDYDGLEVIHIPSSLVWRPDLVLYNKYVFMWSVSRKHTSP